MSVDPRISIGIVRKELQKCQPDIERFNWEVSELDAKNQQFVTKMRSPIDDEQYIIEIKFDDYKELPLFIEFVDPVSGERGNKNAYPTGGGKQGNLFHNHPCICHPCSRKAYKEFSGPHADWSLIGWENNPNAGTLTNIGAILRAIYSRISNRDIYKGRMHACMISF